MDSCNPAARFHDGVFWWSMDVLPSAELSSVGNLITANQKDRFSGNQVALDGRCGSWGFYTMAAATSFFVRTGPVLKGKLEPVWLDGVLKSEYGAKYVEKTGTSTSKHRHIIPSTHLPTHLGQSLSAYSTTVDVDSESIVLQACTIKLITQNKRPNLGSILETFKPVGVILFHSKRGHAHSGSTSKGSAEGSNGKGSVCFPSSTYSQDYVKNKGCPSSRRDASSRTLPQREPICESTYAAQHTGKGPFALPFDRSANPNTRGRMGCRYKAPWLGQSTAAIDCEHWERPSLTLKMLEEGHVIFISFRLDYNRQQQPRQNVQTVALDPIELMRHVHRECQHGGSSEGHAETSTVACNGGSIPPLGLLKADPTASCRGLISGKKMVPPSWGTQRVTPYAVLHNTNLASTYAQDFSLCSTLKAGCTS
eukprot:jgi/Botrbrau1/10641/Bobra.154_1s0030.1